jgi:hypothetical protein
MKRLILITMVVLLSASNALAQDFCKGDFNYLLRTLWKKPVL